MAYKVCKVCKEKFYKKKNESKKYWEDKEYCSIRCSRYKNNKFLSDVQDGELHKNRDWLNGKYCGEKLSMQQIADLCKCSSGNIVYYMKKFNIKRRSRSEAVFLKKKNDKIFLSNKAHEFLIGNVLGDGAMITSYHSKNPRSANYAHSSKYREILEYISSTLEKFNISQMGNIRKYTHPENKAVYYCYWTKSYEELLKFRKSMYKDGKKIIPRDIKFTSDVVLHWYIGDGSLTKPKTGNPYIRICAQGFSDDDVDFAVSEFSKLGITSVRHPSDNSIKVVQKSRDDFLNYIGDCPSEIKKIYGYKFEV